MPNPIKMDPVIRIARLEERLAWFERHATEQDKAMLELAEEISRLRKELFAFRERLPGAGSPGEGDGAGADERPPHY